MEFDYSNVVKEIKIALGNTWTFPIVAVFVFIQDCLFDYPVLGRLFPHLVNEDFIFELRYITKTLILFFAVILIILTILTITSQEIYVENHEKINKALILIHWVCNPLLIRISKLIEILSIIYLATSFFLPDIIMNPENIYDGLLYGIFYLIIILKIIAYISIKLAKLKN